MLKVSRSCYEAMIREARERLPNEACGILSGKKDIATTFYKMTNIERSPVRYLMEPKEQFRVFKEMRLKGERMLGISHSHVASAAYPSKTDVELAFYPEVHYVLVSLQDRLKPVSRAFRIEDGSVREEPLEIVS